MFCKHCGSQIDDDCVFCPKCGKSLQSGGRAASPKARSTESRPAGGTSSAANAFYALISIACAAFVPFAEYRRLVHGVFGVQYWLTCAPILISCFFFYKLIAGKQIEEEKERIRVAKMNGMEYEDQLSKIRTNALTWCCLAVAVVAFASGGIIRLIFL